MGAALVATEVGGVAFRLSRGDAGFVVTRSTPKPETEAVSLQRWRFPGGEGDAAATRLVGEVIDAMGRLCGELRGRAVAAAAKAQRAARSMRAGSGPLRLLQAAAVEATDAYLVTGRALVRQCLDVERLLIEAGLRPADRQLPAWMTEVMRDPEHQKGTSSSA